MTLEDAILEKVRQLPTSEQERVLQFADSLRAKPAIRQVPPEDLSREMEWWAQNRHNPAYMDQFVVINGGQVNLAGTDAGRVAQEARDRGIKIPFIVHITPEDPLPWGGW